MHSPSVRQGKALVDAHPAGGAPRPQRRLPVLVVGVPRQLTEAAPQHRHGKLGLCLPLAEGFGVPRQPLRCPRRRSNRWHGVDLGDQPRGAQARLRGHLELQRRGGAPNLLVGGHGLPRHVHVPQRRRRARAGEVRRLLVAEEERRWIQALVPFQQVDAAVPHLLARPQRQKVRAEEGLHGSHDGAAGLAARGVEVPERRQWPPVHEDDLPRMQLVRVAEEQEGQRLWHLRPPRRPQVRQAGRRRRRPLRGVQRRAARLQG
mmetsp:Transcript_88981/g.236345  ORF Transcript_88981/g.236345 Transcript_88981/m.236345 type:complete len:261 (-) Transcript_88981:132-914(-)